jgi:adenosylhomocysteine nucleosidase
MRVLVTFAVEAEFAPWRKLRKFKKLAAGGSKVAQFLALSESERDPEIGILLTGIGESAASAAVESSRFLTDLKPDLLVSSGFAGALSPALTAGTVIVPEKTRTLKNHANVDSDMLARDAAIQAGASGIKNLITVDRLVKTAEEKSQLAFFGEAVDMESAIVMARFAQFGVPSVAVRAISDVANENLPLDFDRCLTPQGAIKPLNLMNQIVRSPSRLPDILRFGRQSFSAGQQLAAFLEKFLGVIRAAIERPAHV